MVMVTENSDHNRIISMSCLKKMVDPRDGVQYSPMPLCGVMVWALNFDADLFFNY